MPSRSDIQRRREAFARASERQAAARLSAMGVRLFAMLLPLLTSLGVGPDGRLSFDVRNLSQAQRVAIAVEGFYRAEEFSLLRWIFGRLISLFGLNKEYFSTFDTPPQPPGPETIDDRVRRLLLLRYGYDVTADRIDPAGYLAGNLGTGSHAAAVVRRLNEAIAGRTNLADFLRAFRADFSNPASALSLDYHYNRFARDLFQEFDREVQSEYANELGLGFAIYSGTIKDNTRHFCGRRVNNIYTLSEINAWNALKWRGKKPGVDVKVAAGGYNCRHHFSWISEETARAIAEGRGGINNYNAPI